MTKTAAGLRYARVFRDRAYAIDADKRAAERVREKQEVRRGYMRAQEIDQDPVRRLGRTFRTYQTQYGNKKPVTLATLPQDKP